jgi:hypothetical protein
MESDLECDCLEGGGGVGLRIGWFAYERHTGNESSISARNWLTGGAEGLQGPLYHEDPENRRHEYASVFGIPEPKIMICIQ